MLQTFLATLTPMLTLFLCILVGFLLKKYNILPQNAGKVMAKLETWVFCPALSFSTMARFFTIKTISFHLTNILLAVVGVVIAMAIAIPISYVFIKKKSYERGVYQYALAFANMTYIGDPLVLALFGEEVLSYYKLAILYDENQDVENAIKYYQKNYKTSSLSTFTSISKEKRLATSNIVNRLIIML